MPREIRLDFSANTSKLTSKLEKDVLATLSRLDKAAQKLQFSNFGGTVKTSQSSGRGEYAKIIADLQKIQSLQNNNTSEYLKQERLLAQAIAAENKLKESGIALESKAVALAIQKENLKQASIRTSQQELALEKQKLAVIEAQRRIAPKQTSVKTSDTLKEYALPDIERYQKNALTRKKVIDSEIAASEKALANVLKITSKQTTDEIIKDLDRVRKERLRAASESVKSYTSGVSSSFKNSAIAGAVGGLIPTAAQLVGELPQQISEAFNKGLQFQQTEIALANVTGSMDKAKLKIQELVGVARDTAGLSFKSAVEGQTRLESVGFEATKATELLKGLANVRVMSGSTKQDFDAVIYNMTQIRAQGKLTGDELRETIGRMPFIARVIKETFGTIDTKKIADLGLTSDQFFDKLIKGLQGVPQASNDAGLAVENLSDALERYQTNVGVIISSNPELIALIKTLTARVDESASSYTLATGANSRFQDQMEDSTTSVNSAGNSLNRTTTSLSKLILETEILGTQFDAVMKTLMIRANEVGANLNNLGRIVISSMYTIVNATFVDPINNAIDSINRLTALVKDIPGLGAMPGGNVILSIGNNPLPKLRRDEGTSFSDIYRDDQYEGIKANLDQASVWKQANDQIANYRNNYNKYLQETVAGQKKLAELRNSTNMKNIGGDTPAGSGKKTRLETAGVAEFVTDRTKAEFQQALRSLAPDLKVAIAAAAKSFDIPENLAFAQIFSESRFNPKADSGQAGSLTQFTPGTAKRYGYTVSELKKDPSKALTAWGKYMTFLFDRYGDWELATLAYHQGEGTVDDLVKVLNTNDQTKVARFLKARPKGTQYVKQISALSGLRGDQQFLTASEALSEKDVEKQVELNRALQALQTAQAVYGQEAIKIPQTTDEILKAYEELRKATRERIAGDKSTRQRTVTDSSNIPDWALDQQSDPSLTRQRIVNKEQLDAVKNLNDDLDAQLLSASRLGKEMTVYEQTLRSLSTTYQDLSQAEKDNLLSKAAQVDALNEAQEAYYKFKDIVGQSVDAFMDGGFKGLFDSIKNQFKRFLADMATEWITSKFFKSFGNFGQSGTNQQTGFGNIIGSIKNIFSGGNSVTTGGFAGGQISFGSNNPFALSGAGGGMSSPTLFNNQMKNVGADFYGGNKSASGLTQIPDMLAGMSSGSGTRADMIRQGANVSSYTKLKQFLNSSGIGSAVSGALPAAGIALFLNSLSAKTPLSGALQGGLVGMLAGYINRNKIRRNEETQRDSFMVSALEDLNKIKSEMQAAKSGINVQGLLEQARGVSSNYFTQANALTDKKTRGIAVKDGKERVGIYPLDGAYPNALLNQIYALSGAAQLKADIRDAAGERDRRLVPEFATGGFIPSRNGGHLAIVGEGGYDEYILSTDPKYRQRTMGLLSSFAEKMALNIPKHAMGGVSSFVPQMPNFKDFVPPQSPQIVFAPNLSLVMYEREDGGFDAYLESEDGEKKVVNVVKKMRGRREI